MTVTGIISEFNPFHRGHEVPIEKARAEMGGHGAVVCIMSGNCVQRGDLAIFHKHARAKAAIQGGADLVVELPAPYVLSSAEPFALGGVSILAAMGFPDTRLAFGCEDADLEGLTAAARLLAAPETQVKIAAGMKNGLSYGSASQAAVEGQNNAGALLQKPNNLLAIAYLRAIHRLNASITPLPTVRKGAAHDSFTPADTYASASYFRELIYRGKDEAEAAWTYVSPQSADVFKRELAQGRGPAALSRLENAVLSLLRHSTPPQEGYLDDSEGLSRRIVNMAEKAGSLAELYSLAKTKRYHLSRIRRLILNICLGMSQADRPEIPPYIKVLAANEIGRRLIRKMAKSATLPVITLPGQVKKLGGAALNLLQRESAVTDFQALCFRNPAERRGGSEWRCRPYLAGD